MTSFDVKRYLSNRLAETQEDCKRYNSILSEDEYKGDLVFMLMESKAEGKVEEIIDLARNIGYTVNVDESGVATLG